jgi:hypothetical protein|tara:strand:- start:1420 stop:1752 length:333 start_codon:yes stop_codon:yes gene_type:complete
MEFSQAVAAVVVIPPRIPLELVDQVVVEMVDLLVELDLLVIHPPVAVVVAVEPIMEVVRVDLVLSWFVIKLMLVNQELQKQLVETLVSTMARLFMHSPALVISTTPQEQT